MQNLGQCACQSQRTKHQIVLKYWYVNAGFLMIHHAISLIQFIIISRQTMSYNDFKYYTHIIQKLLASLAGINYSISIRLVQT